MKWSVDWKMIWDHDEITGAWVKWLGIMGRSRSLGEGCIWIAIADLRHLATGLFL